MRLLLCTLGRHAGPAALEAALSNGLSLRGASCQAVDLLGPVLCSSTWQRLHTEVATGAANHHTAAADGHGEAAGRPMGAWQSSCNSADQPCSSSGHDRRLSGSMASSSYSTTAPVTTSDCRHYSSSTSAWWQRHKRSLDLTSSAVTSQPGQCLGHWDSSGARRGLISHALAPKPLPRYRKVDKDFKWKRMVIRIPPQVQTKLQGGYLTLSGQAGSMRINLGHMDPTGLLGMQLWHQQQQQPKEAGSSSSGAADAAAVAQAGSGDTGALLLCISPSKRCFRGIATHIDNAVTGVTQGFLVGLTVKGVGYRLEPAEQVAARRRWYFDRSPAEKAATVYPYKQAASGVRLKVGYSYTAVFPLPEGVRAFFIRPNLMYLYGVDLARVRNTAMAIRKVRPPNTYTGNGIQLADEVVKLRPRGGTR